MRVSSSLSVALCIVIVSMLGGQLRAADPTATGAPTTPLTAAANAALIIKAQQQAQDAEAQGNIPGLVQALTDESDAELRAHHFDQAEKLRLRVLQLQEQHTGKESLAVSDALLSLGWFYNNLGRYEQAQQAFDRCEEIRERLSGAESAPVAEVLNALGSLEENRNNLSLAEAFYQQAIAIREKVLGVENPETATTWNNLATLYWITGDYAAAQPLYMKALAVREKAFGPKALAVAATLNNLALLDSSLGDYDEAEDYFQRVLAIREARLPADHPTIIKVLSQLGLLYVREGDDARAEPLLVRAVQMQEKTYPADDPDVARSQMQLGLLYDRLKLYDKAQPLLVRSLEARRRTLGTSHPEYAASLEALARHEHEQARLQEALPLYEQALKIDQEALGDNHPDTLEITADLAYLKLELGQRDDAVKLANDVADAQQKALNGVFTFTAERQRMDFAKTIEPSDLPAALGDADLLAQVVLRTKGVVLDSLLEDEALARAARDPEVRDLMEKQRLLLARLTRAQEDASGIAFSDSPEAIADRKQMEKDEQELEASLAEKGVGSGKTRRALATDVSDVQGAIPQDAALVEYIAYNHYAGHLRYEPAYGAVVLTRDSPARWIELGAATAIDNQVRTYQKYMRKRVREAALAEVLTGLYQSLVAPVTAGLSPGTHRLIISPDGNLNFISFATLLDPNDRFLGEDFELNYVSSGRDLLERVHSTRSSGTDHHSLAIFAAPDYGHIPTASGKGRMRVASDDLLAPLPGTDREASFLLNEARADGMSVLLYRGAEASKENIAKLNSPDVLHLATHGLYLSADDVPNLPPGLDGSKVPAGQAMSRSLLALAGASVTLQDWKKGVFPPPDNDGLLTAQEVANLNLDHTWLVVLSACDTGSGEAQIGEGVLGLRRGFAEAGAENLLMTLWPVQDAGTADLMQAFYREALRGGDAPGALARVQRATLVDVRKKSGLSEAVRQAGPFILSY
jgi:CHAT domain-containing protein/Tfp pilus assembly protein PilF